MNESIEQRKAVAFDWLVAKMEEKFKEADEERLKLTHAAMDESEKWKKEKDMYGWNYHQGRAVGTIDANLIYARVWRLFHSFVQPEKLALEVVEEEMKG